MEIGAGLCLGYQRLAHVAQGALQPSEGASGDAWSAVFPCGMQSRMPQQRAMRMAGWVGEATSFVSRHGHSAGRRATLPRLLKSTLAPCPLAVVYTSSSAIPDIQVVCAGM